MSNMSTNPSMFIPKDEVTKRKLAGGATAYACKQCDVVLLPSAWGGRCLSCFRISDDHPSLTFDGWAKQEDCFREWFQETILLAAKQREALAKRRRKR